MKPPPFVYVAPTSLDEAVAALAEHGEDAKVLAGGQSLIPLLSLRLARPTALVDLNGVAELVVDRGQRDDRHRRDDPSPSGRALGRRREAGSPARGRRSLHRPRRDPHSRARSAAAWLTPIPPPSSPPSRSPSTRPSRPRAPVAPARSARPTSSSATSRPPSRPTRSSRRSRSRTPLRAPVCRCRRWRAATATSRWSAAAASVAPGGDVRIALINVVRPAGQSGRGRGRDRDKERRSTKLPRLPHATSTRPPTCTRAPRTAARSRRSWSGEH